MNIDHIDKTLLSKKRLYAFIGVFLLCCSIGITGVYGAESYSLMDMDGVYNSHLIDAPKALPNDEIDILGANIEYNGTYYSMDLVFVTGGYSNISTSTIKDIDLNATLTLRNDVDWSVYTDSIMCIVDRGFGMSGDPVFFKFSDLHSGEILYTTHIDECDTYVETEYWYNPTECYNNGNIEEYSDAPLFSCTLPSIVGKYYGVVLFTPNENYVPLPPLPQDYEEDYMQEDIPYLEENTEPKMVTSPTRLGSTAFDEKYDLRKYGYAPTTERDQGQFGTCYAHAAIVSVESNILKNPSKNSYGFTPDSIDLSELQAAYFLWNRNGVTVNQTDYFKQYFKGLEGDNVQPELYTWGKKPGNPKDLMKLWMSGIGIALDEGELNYRNMEIQNDNPTLSPDYAVSKNIYHMTNCDIVYTRDEIKQHILDTGACTMNYYDDDAYRPFVWFGNSYYCSESSILNHAVSVIGWDDTYSVDKFVSKPPEPGAWLVKNSWGSSLYAPYFWISYYDANIYKSGCAFFEVEPSGKYDYIYQYDGGILNLDLGPSGSQSVTAKNVFTAEGSQEIYAVAFETNKEDVTYTVKIVKNDQTVYEKKGDEKLSYSGYHTILLDTPVSVALNDVFEIWITLEQKNGITFVADSAGSSGSITAKEGRSYLLINGGWYDYSAYNLDFRIKAFAADTATPTPTLTKNPTPTPTVSPSSAIQGDSVFLTSTDPVQYTCTNVPDKTTIVWSSSKDWVGAITGWKGNTCTFTPRSNGKTTIKVMRSDGNTKLWKGATLEITVELHANEISLSYQSGGTGKIECGRTLQISATPKPIGSIDTVTWSSSNPSIASVNGNGLVTGLSVGSTYIYAKSNINPDIYARTLVAVEPVKPKTLTLTMYSISGSGLLTSDTFSVGTPVYVQVTVSPEDTANRAVTWSLLPEDSGEITVLSAQTITVTPKKAGTATITAKANADNKVTASRTLFFTQPVTSITIQDEPGLSSPSPFYIGEKRNLTAVADPANAYEKSVKWTCNQTDCAEFTNYTIDSSGNPCCELTAKKSGTVLIRAESVENPDIYDEVILEIVEKIPVTDIQIKCSNISTGEEETGNLLTVDNIRNQICLSAVVTPDNATVKDVLWTLDRADLAQITEDTVNKTVILKALGLGTVTVTAAAADGFGANTSQTFRIIQPVKAVSLTGSETVEKGTTALFRYTVTPENAFINLVKWSSENANIASVDSTGNVTGRKAGTTNISVDVMDGLSVFTATKTITVPKSADDDKWVVKVEDNRNSGWNFDTPYTVTITLRSEPPESADDAGDTDYWDTGFIIPPLENNHAQYDNATWSFESNGPYQFNYTMGRLNAYAETLIPIMKSGDSLQILRPKNLVSSGISDFVSNDEGSGKIALLENARQAGNEDNG